MSKKEDLLLNTARIIYEEGIQKLTIDLVAKQSGMTKGGVLYHFENKDALLMKMNEFVIEQFDAILEKHLATLSGKYRYTRAYGLATLEYVREHKILLPAVFITSFENEQCANLWEKTLHNLEKLFEEDDGNAEEILSFRLLCDGIWFSLMYREQHHVAEKAENLLVKKIQAMEEA